MTAIDTSDVKRKDTESGVDGPLTTKLDVGVSELTLSSPQGEGHEHHAVMRTHGLDKVLIGEAVVSQKNPSLTACQPWRLLLRISENDHKSGWLSMQRMLDYLWFEKSGSLQSVRSYCGMIATFCRRAGMNPDQLVTLSREEIEKEIRNYCNKIVERNRANGLRSARGANTVLACLKSLFACNGFNRGNNSELRLKCYRQPPRTTNRQEYIPTLREALTMAERAACKRDRAMILTGITTGLRNTALRAMRISDIYSELNQGQTVLLVRIDPSCNDRIPGACKNCIPYYVFIGAKATEAIRAMLEERIRIFGSYSQDEPLFVTAYNQILPEKRRKTPLTARELQIIVQKAAIAANLKEAGFVHVHTLRKVYEGVLRSGLDDGDRMDIKDQEFLMGHILPGSQDNYYDSTKVERLRALATKLVFEDRSQDEIRTTTKLAALVGLDATSMIATKEGELGKRLSVKERQEFLDKEISTALKKSRGERTRRRQQKIISPSQLKEYVENGWFYVGSPSLPDGNIIVERYDQE